MDETVPASGKRILFALAWSIFALHRFYVGKWKSGLAQAGLIAAASVWLQRATAGLAESAGLDEALDWFNAHGAPIGPLLLLLAGMLWVAWDGLLLLARRFTDADGRKLARWV